MCATLEQVANNQYVHPEDQYAYWLHRSKVVLRMAPDAFDKFKQSREHKKLQDLVTVTRIGEYVHVAAKRFAVVALDGIPRRGHLVWLRAFNRFHLAAPASRRTRKSRAIAVKYNSEGAVEGFIETKAIQVKPLAKHKHVYSTQPTSKSKHTLVDRFRRSA